MPQFIHHEEVKGNRVQRELPNGHKQWRTDFVKAPEGQDAPQAFLAESTPKRLLRTHYHEVDQFQIIMHGGGVLGKHKLAPLGVHFTRAYTPYGPIINNDQGIGFMTLRARKDWGRAQYLPEKREELNAITHRTPWQVTELGEFVYQGDANIYTFRQIRDERGLGAFTLTLKPHASINAPDPTQTDGQYIVITKGSAVYNGASHASTSVAFVKPEDGPQKLGAGADGMEALVLNFPRRVPVVEKALRTSTQFKVWQCDLCAFSYDEAVGMPDEGIAAGTRWEDVPESWTCPDCSTGKSDFQMRVVN